MIPIRAIPDKRIDYAVGQRHEHGRRIVRRSLPVRVEVGKHRRRIILLTLPASPILLRLEPQVPDDKIVLRLVGTTKRMILAVGFGIRLSRRLLRLADLAIRGGQVALGLRDILPGLRQVGLRLRERLIRRVEIRLVGLDVLLGLRQLRRIILQRRLIVSQILLDSFDLFRRDRGSHGDSGDCRPVGTVARMIDSTESVCVRRASRQTGNHIIADTGRDGRDLPENTISQTFAENIPIPVDGHGPAISGFPIPSNRNHAQLGRENRLGWDRRRCRVLGDSQREHAGPFAHLVGIRWNGTHSDKNLNTAIQIRPRQRMLSGRASGMPLMPSLVHTIFDRIRRDVHGGAISRQRHIIPTGRNHTTRIPVHIDIRVGIGRQILRSLRHAMVLFRSRNRTGRSTKMSAPGNAVHTLRQTNRGIIILVVQNQRSLETLRIILQRDLLDTDLLTVRHCRRGNPIAYRVIDKRQTRRFYNIHRPRVLSANPSRVSQRRFDKLFCGLLLVHTLLARIQFPTAPRLRSVRIILTEINIVATYKNRGSQPVDTLVIGSLRHILRKRHHTRLGQVTADGDAIDVPQQQLTSIGTPIA